MAFSRHNVQGKPVTDPDADILAALASGDAHALSTLMDRHLGTLHAFATRMIADPVSAEDIVQTVFLKTWQNAPQWKTGRATLLTWMRRVTLNQCLDHLKKKRPIYTDQLPDIPDNTPTALDGLQRQERDADLHRAIMDLPPRQRAALILSYFENLSQKDGALSLGISEKAYEALLVRGRRTLRIQLGQRHAPRHPSSSQVEAIL